MVLQRLESLEISSFDQHFKKTFLILLDFPARMSEIQELSISISHEFMIP